jgi:hypothetical protein
MATITSTRRSDEQLELMLYEVANWTVQGVQGVVLSELASLRLAIERAVEFATREREVIALMHRRPPEIVVLSDQLQKLKDLLVQSPATPTPLVAVSANETAGYFFSIRSAMSASDMIYLEAV